jgi:hypothetical protein
MLQDAIERLLALVFAALIGITVGCRFASPAAHAPADVDQNTTATQVTAQAAPGSVVQVGTPSGSAATTQPP